MSIEQICLPVEQCLAQCFYHVMFWSPSPRLLVLGAGTTLGSSRSRGGKSPPGCDGIHFFNCEDTCNRFSRTESAVGLTTVSLQSSTLVQLPFRGF